MPTIMVEKLSEEEMQQFRMAKVQARAKSWREFFLKLINNNMGAETGGGRKHTS